MNPSGYTLNYNGELALVNLFSGTELAWFLPVSCYVAEYIVYDPKQVGLHVLIEQNVVM